jgi:hypothetical protein
MRALALGIFTAVAIAFTPQAMPQQVQSAAYKHFIEPLLTAPDFHTSYYEDGAADATVTCPGPCDGQSSPIPVVSALMNSSAVVPLLIDCLNDGRLTSIHFDGNATTRPMQVPVGYVCLDILTSEFTRKPIVIPGCANDGLGACVYTGFYFRPDDYFGCIKTSCEPRPWVIAVQKNWRRQLAAGTLKLTKPSQH